MEERIIGGVCVNISRYIGMNVGLVRVLFIALSLWTTAPMVFIYFIIWFLMDCC